MKLNFLIAQIVSAENFDNFSALELRAAFLVLQEDKSLCPVEARRFCYAELIKLVRRNWLKKIKSNKTGAVSYKKTASFNAEKVLSETTGSMIEKPKPLPRPDKVKAPLLNRLNRYKKELLISFGELEEYEQLSQAHPELNEQLQDKYNQAREQNSALLGKIKAIENLLNPVSKP